MQDEEKSLIDEEKKWNEWKKRMENELKKFKKRCRV